MPYEANFKGLSGPLLRKRPNGAKSPVTYKIEIFISVQEYVAKQYQIIGCYFLAFHKTFNTQKFKNCTIILGLTFGAEAQRYRHEAKGMSPQDAYKIALENGVELYKNVRPYVLELVNRTKTYKLIVQSTMWNQKILKEIPRKLILREGTISSAEFVPPEKFIPPQFADPEFDRKFKDWANIFPFQNVDDLNNKENYLHAFTENYNFVIKECKKHDGAFNTQLEIAAGKFIDHFTEFKDADLKIASRKRSKDPQLILENNVKMAQKKAQAKNKSMLLFYEEIAVFLSSYNLKGADQEKTNMLMDDVNSQGSNKLQEISDDPQEAHQKGADVLMYGVNSLGSKKPGEISSIVINVTKDLANLKANYNKVSFDGEFFLFYYCYKEGPEDRLGEEEAQIAEELEGLLNSGGSKEDIRKYIQTLSLGQKQKFPGSLEGNNTENIGKEEDITSGPSSRQSGSAVPLSGNMWPNNQNPTSSYSILTERLMITEIKRNQAQEAQARADVKGAEAEAKKSMSSSTPTHRYSSGLLKPDGKKSMSPSTPTHRYSSGLLKADDANVKGRQSNSWPPPLIEKEKDAKIKEWLTLKIKTQEAKLEETKVKTEVAKHKRNFWRIQARLAEKQMEEKNATPPPKEEKNAMSPKEESNWFDSNGYMFH